MVVRTRVVFLIGLALVLCRSGPPASAAAPGKSRLDRFGDPLPGGAIGRLGTIRLWHGHGVDSVAFSPDGKTIASAGDYGACLWDAATGVGIVRLFGHSGGVKSIDFSADGKTLVGEGNQLSRQVFFWDARSGQLLRTPARRYFSIHPAYTVRSLALSANGRFLALPATIERPQRYERVVRLIDPATGREVKRIVQEKDQQDSLFVCTAFSPDGKTLAVGTWDGGDDSNGTVCLFDADTARRIRTISAFKGAPLCLAFSPDGRTLAGGDELGLVRVWDTAAGKQRRLHRAHRSAVTSVLFTPDGAHIVTGSSDRISLWEARSGKEVRPFLGHDGLVCSLALSPDGKRLAGAAGSTIRLWDLTTGKPLLPFGSRLPIRIVAFQPDGRLLASAGGGTILLQDWRRARTIRRIDSEGMRITALAWAPDGRNLAVGDENELRLLDAAGGKVLARFAAGHDQVEHATFTPDGKALVSWHASGLVRVWSRSTGKLIRSFGHKRSGQAAGGFGVLSPDGAVAAVWSTNEPARLWRLADGQRIGSLGEPGQSTSSGAFSPDGRLFALASRDIRVWEVATVKEVRRLKGHQYGVDALAFSPDGRILASAGNDEEIRLWNIATGKELRRLIGHGDGGYRRISALDFSRAGVLASGGEDTTILLWAVTPPPGPAGPEPSADELAGAWEALRGSDAARAYDAIHCFVRAPQQSPRFLKRRLRPVVPINPEKIARLVAALDSDQFDVREKAMLALAKMEELVSPALEAALRAPSLEVRRRAGRLLMRLTTPIPPEKMRDLRACAALEYLGNAEARELLKELAAGAANARLTKEAGRSPFSA